MSKDKCKARERPFRRQRDETTTSIESQGSNPSWYYAARRLIGISLQATVDSASEFPHSMGVNRIGRSLAYCPHACGATNRPPKVDLRPWGACFGI